MTWIIITTSGGPTTGGTGNTPSGVLAACENQRWMFDPSFAGSRMGEDLKACGTNLSVVG